MMTDLLFLLSFVMLFFGGELLVKSSVVLALKMRVSTLVIGMTVVSLATSSPELFVSLQSALREITDITFGNIIGSNIANITLVLGLTAIIFRIKISKQTIVIDYPFMLFTSIFFGCIIYFYGEISQITGILFLILLIVFGWVLIRRSQKENLSSFDEKESEYHESSKTPLYIAVFYMVMGVILLKFGSEFLVEGVTSIAGSFGWSERVISVSIVAFGTSIPELSTSLVAAFRKEPNLAVGNLIGSNIFNILAVLGITSIIHPIKFSSTISSSFHPLIIDYFWMIGCTILLGIFIYFFSKKILNKLEGVILFTVYIVCMYFLLQ